MPEVVQKGMEQSTRCKFCGDFYDKAKPYICPDCLPENPSLENYAEGLKLKVLPDKDGNTVVVDEEFKKSLIAKIHTLVDEATGITVAGTTSNGTGNGKTTRAAQTSAGPGVTSESDKTKNDAGVKSLIYMSDKTPKWIDKCGGNSSVASESIRIVLDACLEFMTAPAEKRSKSNMAGELQRILLSVAQDKFVHAK